MFCSGPWDYDAIMEKNPELQLDMMPFYGTKRAQAGSLVVLAVDLQQMLLPRTLTQ